MNYIKSKDIKNQDLLYDPKINFQVMMEWEKPYMNKLIKHLEPKGHVLEIGFGLGYSAWASLILYFLMTHRLKYFQMNII